jgi:hypothetical protein
MSAHTSINTATTTDGSVQPCQACTWEQLLEPITDEEWERVKPSRAELLEALKRGAEDAEAARRATPSIVISNLRFR